MRTPEQVIASPIPDDVPPHIVAMIIDAREVVDQLLNDKNRQEAQTVARCLDELEARSRPREGLVINKAVTREEIAVVLDPAAFLLELAGLEPTEMVRRRAIALNKADAILALISAGGGK